MDPHTSELVPAFADLADDGLHTGAVKACLHQFESMRGALAARLGVPPGALDRAPAGRTASELLRRLWRPWLYACEREPNDSYFSQPTWQQMAAAAWHTGLLSKDALAGWPSPAAISTDTGIAACIAQRGVYTKQELEASTERLFPARSDVHRPTLHLVRATACELLQPLLEPGVEGSDRSYSPVSADESDPAILGSSLAGIVKALDLLEHLGLDLWVSSFASEIILLSSSGPYSGRYSVSDPGTPGLVALDARGPLCDIVESLVHEASHQAFYFCELESPMTDGVVRVPSLFRSGLRTMRRHLAAAQAFGNSIIALSALGDLLPDEQHRIKARIAVLMPKTAATLSMLRGHQSMTPRASAWITRLASCLPAGAVGSEVSGRVFEFKSVPIEDSYDPTQWRVSKAAWFAQTMKSTHCSGAEEGALAVATAWLEASAQGEEWAYHPILSSLGDARVSISRRIAAWLWIARHTRGLPSFDITLPSAMVLWTEEGGARLKPGQYEIHELARNMHDHRFAPRPRIDCWCLSVDPGVEPVWSSESSGIASREFGADLRSLAEAFHALETALPSWWAWLGDYTRLVVPIRCAAAGRLNSVSRPDQPGVVFLTPAGGALQTCELLVHETAHLNLFAEEAAGPLVDSGHRDLYWSPLRKDPRPLRGILLAYHALAFMCAFYSDAQVSGAWPDSEVEDSARPAREMAVSCNAVIAAVGSGLTDRGRDFVHRTREVLSYGLRHRTAAYRDSKSRIAV